MVLHPEIQEKAQAEIDAILGDSRLPEMSDRESMPYVCCIVKEVLRWWPVFPLGTSSTSPTLKRSSHAIFIVLGVPHASTQDDIYRGYRIPKGATMCAKLFIFDLL